MREATITRSTRETDITAKLNLDGSGICKIDTGIGFFDHMLNALTVHGGMDLELKAMGDLHVDGHHTVEDTGIVLGTAFREALKTSGAIARYGSAFVPMDESLALASLDISNRPYLVFDCEYSDDRTGTFDNCLTEEFFRAFAFNAGITLHIKLIYGSNDHHKIEAIFKAVAHALKAAKAVTGGEVLSTKGVI
ncbi:MAG: imidazoleglycerol-phosphate dehydratase HisB [Oscillospiraceae bacterium]|nr:imidazoleglycerol-phosphate dehydratase HisB [Oscillospiraceae bacterium]